MNIYTLDKESLSYNTIPKKLKTIFVLTILFLIITSFFLGVFFGKSIPEHHPNFIMASKYDLNPEHDMIWKDSIFKNYAIMADAYLSRPIFKGTPLKGEMLSLCARNAYDSTGILLPLELALSQAQYESGMGREGKSPKNNPFNIGEYDSGTVQWFNSTFEGTQAYYYYICKNYLKNKSVDELFVNFVNHNGDRYASIPSYEKNIRGQYYAIKNWIDKNLKQN